MSEERRGEERKEGRGLFEEVRISVYWLFPGGRRAEGCLFVEDDGGSGY